MIAPGRPGGQTYSHARRGMALIVVAVVVAMLSLAGLSFVVTMSTENRAVHFQASQLQLEHVVGSGIELLKVFCEQSWESQQAAGGSWDNPDQFSGVLVLEEGEGGRAGRFSVVAPRDDGDAPGGVRFGVEDESARLNLGVLLQWESREPGAARRALMSLPGMTEMIADAILDWIDPDGSPRPSGAEAEYYQGLGFPYAPRNGVPQCLEELLLVRGVTRDLLFGGDGASNRRTGPGEGRATPRGGAALQELPWAALVTVSSAERNETLDGRPRIDLNQTDLVALRKELAAALDQPSADFIVLYRQSGPYRGLGPANDDRAPVQVPRLPGKVRIESILDLVDARVLIQQGKTGKPRIVASPWTSQPFQMREDLPKLLDRTSVVSGPVIYGRINVHLAPREVLRAVPGMDPALVERIVGARRSSGRQGAERRDPIWLLTEGVADMTQMKAILPYVTGGGDVVRAQVIGFFDGPGASMRVETVIDATANPPRQVYWKDLRLLGRGYSPESLGAERR